MDSVTEIVIEKNCLHSRSVRNIIRTRIISEERAAEIRNARAPPIERRRLTESQHVSTEVIAKAFRGLVWKS